LGIALGSLIGGKAAAMGNFDTTLTISAGIALAGCVINGIVVPRPPLVPRVFGLAVVGRVLAARCAASCQIGGRRGSGREPPNSSPMPCHPVRVDPWNGRGHDANWTLF
jgi:hypothetical protein